MYIPAQAQCLQYIYIFTLYRKILLVKIQAQLMHLMMVSILFIFSGLFPVYCETCMINVTSLMTTNIYPVIPLSEHFFFAYGFVLYKSKFQHTKCYTTERTVICRIV